MPRKYEKKTLRRYIKQTPAPTPKASEIFNDEDNQTLCEMKERFTIGEKYELPLPVCYGANSGNIDIEFEYVGTVGNNTKLQFREIHGGWTVTLAPIQLLRMKGE